MKRNLYESEELIKQLYKSKELIDEDVYEDICDQLNLRFFKSYVVKQGFAKEEYRDLYIRSILNTDTGSNYLKFPCRECGRYLSINDLNDHTCFDEDIIINSYMNGYPEANIGISEDPDGFINRFPLDEKDIGMKVYRGLYFKSKEEQEKFLEEIKDNTIRLYTFSSWSGDYRIAQNFALFDDVEMVLSNSSKEEIVERSIVNPNKFGVIISTEVHPDMVIAKVPEKYGVYDEAEFIMKEGLYSINIEKIF